MSQTRRFLPYALVSATIVVATSVALAINTSAPNLAVPALAPRATGSAALSADARLAYWREGRDRRWELWVGDVDGARRWVVASEGSIGIPSQTRWRPDGEAVAYVRERDAFVIAPLVGDPRLLQLSSELLEDHRAIVGYEWSPDGTRIAATLRDARGASRESDVWILEVPSGSWLRATRIGDALAAQWVDDDELLIESMSGFLGIVRIDAEMKVRPVTGMRGVSPRIESDGRLYIAGGAGSGGIAGPVPYGSGGIWSMALDGTDVRREPGGLEPDVRLVGRWVDDRFVVSRAGSVEVLGEPRTMLPWSAGLIRQVVTLPERRVLAFTGDRILELDPDRIEPLAGLYTPSPSLRVLLDGVYFADLWRPPTRVDPLRSGGAPLAAMPPAAFLLGNAAWLVNEGAEPIPLVQGGSDGWMGMPRWSPNGDLLGVIRSSQDRVGSALYLFDRAGREVRRIPAWGSFSWSPDGIALVHDRWTEGGGSEARLVRLSDPDGSEPLEGSTAVWTEGGILVHSASGVGATARQRIDLIAGGSRRTLVDSTGLARHPLLAGIGDASSQLSLFSAQAPVRGPYFSANVYRCCGSRSDAVVVLRLSDGGVVNVIADDRRGGFAPLWSPDGRHFGHTTTLPPASNRDDLARVSPPIALVRDAASGEVVASGVGEFAGWSADGGTWYAGRSEGLFAQALGGGDGVLVSPYGVQVSVAPR